MESSEVTAEEIKRYFLAVVEGIEALHKKGLRHGDVKLENLFITEDYQLKIGDLGFVAETEELVRSYLATHKYCAPEIIDLKPFDGVKADMFSLGVVLFVLLLKDFPF